MTALLHQFNGNGFICRHCRYGLGGLMPKTLIDDPRYVEMVAQMRDNLNREGAELGLGTVGY
jgi:hypothetical protein